MATVTSFSELMTILNGSGNEDVYIANDIDALSEGYDYVNNFTINCNLDGGGHTISNVTALSKSGLGIAGNSAKTVKNVEFDKFLVKGVDSNYTFAYEMYGGPITLQNCKFGIKLDATGGNMYVGAPSGSGNVNECAFDITCDRCQGLGTYNNDTYSMCNFVIRNFTTYNFTWSSRQYLCAFVLDNCNFAGGQYNIDLTKFTSSYLALENCTGTARITGNASNNTLFCNNGGFNPVNVSGVTIVTPAQLKSESALREIGFIP